MKRNLLCAFTALSVFAVSSSLALAADATNTNATNSHHATVNITAKSKPLNKVSELNNMPDDATVYVQGYIVQNLGDDNYLFQDDTGTVAVEVDDDMIEGNGIAPNTMVYIVASIDKDGNISSLEAEEIQFIPENTEQQMSSNMVKHNNKHNNQHKPDNH